LDDEGDHDGWLSWSRGQDLPFHSESAEECVTENPAERQRPGDLDIPGSYGNDTGNGPDQLLPALTKDEVGSAQWEEIREALKLKTRPLGRRDLAALAPRPGGESPGIIGLGRVG